MHHECRKDAAVGFDIYPGHHHGKPDAVKHECPETCEFETHLSVPGLWHKEQRQMPDAPDDSKDERAAQNAKPFEQRVERVAAPAEFFRPRSGEETHEERHRDDHGRSNISFQVGHTGQGVTRQHIQQDDESKKKRDRKEDKCPIR